MKGKKMKKLIGLVVALMPMGLVAAPLPAVAILGAVSTPAWNSEVQAKLVGTGRFSSVAVVDVVSTTPTLATLQQYRALLVYPDANYSDPNALGDVLADYIDGGGAVVEAVFGNYVYMGGRYASGNYSTFDVIQNCGRSSGPLTLGTIRLPASSLVAGVTTFNGGSSSYNACVNGLAAGAVDVADWSDGSPLIAYKLKNGHPIVALGFYPPSRDSRSDFWDPTTDGAKIMANALLFTVSAPTNVPAPPPLEITPLAPMTLSVVP
ncbi:MAG: hypothetical protein EBY17_31570, partial [Acidobacteriia bacterium]|nr:hypothetical protein [Terriglobia bacterium]